MGPSFSRRWIHTHLRHEIMALKFAPFGSEIELPFYDNLSQSKIDHDKLDDSARRVLGLYEPRMTSTPDESCKMMILGNALTSEEWVFPDFDPP